MNVQDLQRQLQQIITETPVETLPQLLGVLAQTKAAVWLRMTTPASTPTSTAGLVDAGEMAQLLGVPENWVRDKARASLIPFVRLGHYVRFEPPAVIEAVRKLGLQHNRTLCVIKKSTGNRGDTRRVSNECPTSSGAERAKSA